MFERFTEEARRSLFFARQAVTQYGGNQIDPEHIVLGIIGADRGIVGRFAASDEALDTLHARLTAQLPGVVAAFSSHEVPFSSRTVRIMGRAAVEADELRDPAIRSEHLLLATLVKDSSGAAASALTEAGVTVAAIRQALQIVSPASASGKVSAREALARLREGNLRFATNVQSDDVLLNSSKRAQLPVGQEPFAIILGCSDSRVPAEIVFDQGLGDLFVIRVAGNIVASSQVGSVEFAAARFGTRLVVVLGHSQCGAILSTLEELQRPRENQSRNLRSIVDRVRPSVEGLLQTNLKHDLNALVEQAVRANIRVSVNHLRNGSVELEQLIRDDGLLIVGAEYSLESGLVDFFDGAPS